MEWSSREVTFNSGLKIAEEEEEAIYILIIGIITVWQCYFDHVLYDIIVISNMCLIFELHHVNLCFQTDTLALYLILRVCFIRILVGTYNIF